METSISIKQEKIIVKLAKLLADATSRLEGFMGTDCECDNTHEQNGTTCALCEYRAEIALTWK